MSDKKYYSIATTTTEAWDYVHSVLTADGSIDDNIPSRPIECTDPKEHSPTRSVYLLSDIEAQQLNNHPDVVYVELDKSQYPDLYPPSPDEMHCVPNRYNNTAYCYRNTRLAPYFPIENQLNRNGYQIYRCSQYNNPWQGFPVDIVFQNRIQNTTTGRNVDVIVGDDGCWFGHVEFANNTGNGPSDYVGGNRLPGNGTCDLLDMVLEGPYYIDPAWFNASPSTRLTTRWDGTIVPVESVAKSWWSNASQRSSTFLTAGTVAIPANYTRENCNGTDLALSNEGDHGTACAGQTYGRTYGWAYNANKWFIDAYGVYGFGTNVDLYFDVMKIFHLNKPINPVSGTRDPTISSNSWGFRSSVPDTGYYYFRQGTTGSGGVAYTDLKPEFMRYLGSAGDAFRVKGEMITNSLTTAGDELITAGVIFVVAAGNNNQKQVGSSNSDYNNYWSLNASTPLSSATHSEFGSLCYNTTSRRGFPQGIGSFDDGTGTIVYPVINIGALDDQTTGGSFRAGLERKVSYSDMGEQIDAYAPGDNTLTSSRTTPYPGQTTYDRLDQRAGGITSYDTTFNGTSSACPSATGLIACLLENHRDWTWEDVRNYITNLTEQSASTFYQGPDPSTATSGDWSDLNSLMGGTRRVLYNVVPPVATVTGTGLSFTGSGLTFTT
jgi:hypothetical protein